MKLSHVFSHCFIFGHDHPVKVMQGKVFRFQCPRCTADLGGVLEGQKFKKRKAVKVRKRRSAKVLHLAKKQA
jgi:hypothetical protein